MAGKGTSRVLPEPMTSRYWDNAGTTSTYRNFEPARRRVPLGLLYGPSPPTAGSGPNAGDDNLVALPGVVGLARQQDAGHAPVIIDPEELLDVVRLPRLPPPPLHVRCFPETGPGVGQASALQQLGRQRQRFKPRRSYLSHRHAHLLKLAVSQPNGAAPCRSLSNGLRRRSGPPIMPL